MLAARFYRVDSSSAQSRAGTCEGDPLSLFLKGWAHYGHITGHSLKSLNRLDISTECGKLWA